MTMEIERYAPTRNLVWIKPDRRVLERPSGLLVPQWSDGRDWPTQTGWVFALGPHADESELAIGDYVIFEIYAGPEVKWRDDAGDVSEEYVIVSEKDVIAVFERESVHV